MRNSWTGGQYSLFRALFGIYLFVHFAHLLPWSAELFSSAGMIPNGRESPLLLLFPNVFALVDHPLFVQALVAGAAGASLLFCIGYRDKWAAVFLWYVLACLFGRNPLIANPSLPYVGWMLLAHLFIPSAPYGSWASRGRADPDNGWRLPPFIFLAAWVVLALSYSYSGYTKLFSPSWVAGTNVAHVLDNPLARDWFLRDLFLWLPPILLQLLTWFILVVELLFAAIVLFRPLRPWAWGAMLFVQVGFAFLLSFPDLTFAMLLFHLFTFDPGWVKPARRPAAATLFFDGTCALCHGTVRFLLAEDRASRLSYSPLQGQLIHATLPKEAIAALPDSMVLVTSDGERLVESAAVLRCLQMLGGLWTILGFALWYVPKPVRDFGYRTVGRKRYAWFGRKQEICPLMPDALRGRFLA
jgi:predicted DCC family thiol-disulfide oxidoreductase YuxK